MNFDNMPSEYGAHRAETVTARIRKIIRPHTENASVIGGVEEIVEQIAALEAESNGFQHLLNNALAACDNAIEGARGMGKLLDQMSQERDEARAETTDAYTLVAGLVDMIRCDAGEESWLKAVDLISKKSASTTDLVSMDILYTGATENERLRDGIDVIHRHSIRGWNGDDFAKVQAFARMALVAEAMNSNPPLPFESNTDSDHVPDLGTVDVVSVNYATVTIPVLAKSKCGRFSIHNVVLFNGEFSDAYNITHSETGTAITAGSTLGGGFFWRRLDQCVEFMDAFTAELSLSDIVYIHGKWCVKTRIKVLRDELIQSMTPELTFICVTPNGYAQSDADYVPGFERAESAALAPSENESQE